MIFERAARREFAQAAAGISVALLAILTSVQLIRLLKDAVGGSIAADGVVVLLGFAVLKVLPMLLTLTLFVSILLSMSRMYRDSEVVVWMSSGLPLTAWIHPVMRFALPVALVVALLSVGLAPWATKAQADYRLLLASRSELSRVSPGVFQEIRRGRQVVFVEEVSDKSGRVGNVFVATVQDGKLGVVMSDAGYQEVGVDGESFVVLEKGRRYEVEPGSVEFKVMTFDRYKVRAKAGAIHTGDRSAANRMNLFELMDETSGEGRGELLWRLAMPVSALVLALLAIPLSYVNPRAGRSANMLIAVLVYAVYSNLITVVQAWVVNGKLPFAVGLWLPHVFMLVPMLILFRQRSTLGRKRWFS